jgi:hypothetical protein
MKTQANDKDNADMRVRCIPLLSGALRRIFHPSSLPVALLGIYKLKRYRRWWGGHWELWWVDFPVVSEVWHDVERCSFETGKRPGGLLRGTPTCEDY